MKSNIYKCPRCNATGIELIYDIFVVTRRRVYKNLDTGETREVLENADEYDKIFPIWTRCEACDTHLFGEAKDYIVSDD